MQHKGPFGLSRPFGFGPFVEEKINNPQELFREITFRGHSYRNYEADEFLQLVESGFDKTELRTELRAIEAGRFNAMLEETYDFWIPLDQDEKELFAERNPDLLNWLEVYATLEEVRKPSENIL